MREASYEFLRALISAPAVSGYEEPAQTVVAGYAKGFGARVTCDVHANTFADDGKSARPRIMLTGHVDQVGMMVRYIDENGYINVTNVGGTIIQYAQRVWVHTADGPRLGVVGRKPAAFAKADEQGKTPEPHEWWIDIGIRSGEECKKAVRVGDPVTWTEPLTKLADDLLLAPGLDDKIGVFAAVEALRILMEDGSGYAGSVCALSAVQEEIGCAGAGVAAYAWEPDVAVAIDVWPMVTDTPGTDKARFGEMKLGAGPVLIRGANVNTVLLRTLEEVAQAGEIPVQCCGWPGLTPTDAQSIYRARSGVPTALIGLPQHYLHTPSEVIDLGDLENTIRLLVSLCRRLTSEVDYTRRARIIGD